MGQTPDELCRSIDETRERLTETIRAIKARATIRRHTVDDDPPTPVWLGTGAVDRLLDRVPVEPAAGDLEAEAAAATDASPKADRPGREPKQSAKRNASLIVVLACAAAGAFAGLATSPGSRGSSIGS
jgi:hypothetical protein